MRKVCVKQLGVDKYRRLFLSQLENVAKILRKGKLPLSKKIFDYKHAKALDIITKSMANMPQSKDYQLSGQKSQTPKVWCFWWQGYESAPELVKKTIDSIHKHSGPYEFVLITKDNYKKYSNIDPIILKKFQEGKFSITHFSDILRFNLLAKNGGFWIDSTVLLMSDLTEQMLIANFVSPKLKVDEFHSWVSAGKWTGFAMGGFKGYGLFEFVNQFFIDYWKQHDYLVEYFLIDYAIAIYFFNSKQFQDCINSADEKELYFLLNHCNDKFDSRFWHELSNNPKYQFQKLTYKRNFQKKMVIQFRIMDS